MKRNRRKQQNEKEISSRKLETGIKGTFHAKMGTIKGRKVRA